MTLTRQAIAILLVSLTLSCGPSENATVEIERIARPGFASVNSWLLTSSNGSVLIDTQRVLSAGREAVKVIETSGKPLLAVIITHPHPDHFGGLAAVVEAYPDVPVYASATTTDIIRTDSNGYQAATRQAVPDDTPGTFAVPTQTFEHGETLTFGSIEVTVDEIGAGESETMTMLYAPGQNALFTGDLIANEMTGFVLEGRSAAWLEQIRRVTDDYGDREPTIYPGHGVSGPFSALLDQQAQWLEDLRALVSMALEKGPLTDAAVAMIEAELNARYPDYPMVAEIPPLLSLNIQAVAAEMTAEIGGQLSE